MGLPATDGDILQRFNGLIELPHRQVGEVAILPSAVGMFQQIGHQPIWFERACYQSGGTSGTLFDSLSCGFYGYWFGRLLDCRSGSFFGRQTIGKMEEPQGGTEDIVDSLFHKYLLFVDSDW